MSSLEEKKSELERVLGVFQNYIEGSELLDVVYSKKFGYVLLGLPAADSIDDSDVTRLEDPETLVKEIYQNLAYDFMEQEGHSEDYTEATNLEKRAMREWMKEYTDQRSNALSVCVQATLILEHLCGNRKAKLAGEASECGELLVYGETIAFRRRSIYPAV